MSEPISEPNLYSLSGGDIQVTLSLSGLDGRPLLSYQDDQRGMSFSGDEITFEETSLGRAATVVLVRTVDFGTTEFTLLLPRVNLVGGNHQVNTLGITALHRTTIAGIGHGQLTTYRSRHLYGTASQVET